MFSLSFTLCVVLSSLHSAIAGLRWPTSPIGRTSTEPMQFDWNLAFRYDGMGCTDRKGRVIPFGEMYHPMRDSPCTICECLMDKDMMSCSSIGCDVLQCRDFHVDEDSCCGYVCHGENERYGTFDIRQVGGNSVILQWNIEPDQRPMQVVYRAGFEGNTSWVFVDVGKDKPSALISGLQQGVEYTFTAMVIDDSLPKPLYLRSEQITLEPRVGNAVKFEKAQHEEKIYIHMDSAQRSFDWSPTVYLNLNAFDLVRVEKRVDVTGQELVTLRLYNRVQNEADLRLQFSDVKDYRWVMAHL